MSTFWQKKLTTSSYTHECHYRTFHGFTKIPLNVQNPISNTTDEQQNAVYSYIISVNTYSNRLKSQMGTTLEETLRYALD